MNKIYLILKREFLTRIKKKSFLVMTILSPLLIVLFYVYYSHECIQITVRVDGALSQHKKTNTRVIFLIEALRYYSTGSLIYKST